MLDSEPERRAACDDDDNDNDNDNEQFQADSNLVGDD
jgi:hypothetical protein